MIALPNCKDRFLYKINSRNLSYGVFDLSTNGFIGIREKFGSRYLFTEYHWDTGAPYGTVSPEYVLDMLPEDIPCTESLGIIDTITNRPLVTIFEYDDAGKLITKRFYTDTEPYEEIPKDQIVHGLVVNNKKLFAWLNDMENIYA